MGCSLYLLKVVRKRVLQSRPPGLRVGPLAAWHKAKVHSVARPSHMQTMIVRIMSKTLVLGFWFTPNATSMLKHGTPDLPPMRPFQFIPAKVKLSISTFQTMQ